MGSHRSAIKRWRELGQTPAPTAKNPYGTAENMGDMQGVRLANGGWVRTNSRSKGAGMGIGSGDAGSGSGSPSVFETGNTSCCRGKGSCALKRAVRSQEPSGCRLAVAVAEPQQ